MKDNQTTPLKVLVIDDETAICKVLSDSLKDEGYLVETANDGLHGLAAIESFQPQVVLLDIWMPGDMDGLEVLHRAQSQGVDCEFIVMSGHGNIETAVKATKLGAWDFVEKPLSMDKISILIKNILSFQVQKKEKSNLLNKLRKNIAIIGESAPMMNLKQMISRVAPTDSWVLITGSNGTGKELVAQNIHYLSHRAGKPFVEVNCAAIPDELIESELFGHEKGAFTGAHKSKKGKFDIAHGGTLFLDEIGDMSMDAQAKILRILQEKKFNRVGGNKVIEADVRVVAATNKNLEDLIKVGQFREDLYYRLNVIPFRVPSLSERREDIPMLTEHFASQFTRQSGYVKKFISENAMDKLCAYSWPGNVRELRNFVERLYILTPGEYIELTDLRFAGLPSDNFAQIDDSLTSFREARAQFEREFLLQKINENNGNISKTAELIGLERSYLHRKIKSYGIDVQ